MQQGVSSPVSDAAAAMGLPSLPVVQTLTSERPLVYLTTLSSAERHTIVLKLEEGRGGEGRGGEGRRGEGRGGEGKGGEGRGWEGRGGEGRGGEGRGGEGRGGEGRGGEGRGGEAKYYSWCASSVYSRTFNTRMG